MLLYFYDIMKSVLIISGALVLISTGYIIKKSSDVIKKYIFLVKPNF